MKTTSFCAVLSVVVLLLLCVCSIKSESRLEAHEAPQAGANPVECFLCGYLVGRTENYIDRGYNDTRIHKHKHDSIISF